MSDTPASIWDRSWFKARSGSFGFFSWFFSVLFSLVSFVAQLVDGVAAFFTFLYMAFPPIIERIADAYTKCSEFITETFSTAAETAVDETEAVVEVIQSSETLGDGGSSLWEMVKYMINVDALADFLNFVVSIGWLWIFIVILVLVVATGCLVAGCVIFVTRRFLVFISAGYVNVS